MTAWAKLTATAGLLLCAALAPVNGMNLLVIMALCAAMARRARVPVSRLAFRNAVVLGFAVFFMLAAAASALLRGEGALAPAARLAARTLLVFNAAYLGGEWIGRHGLLRVIDGIPSERVRLFLVLLARAVASFARNSGMIVMQLKSRIGLTARTRLLVARYYAQNLVYYELYALRHSQAALFSRLPERLCVYHRPVPMGVPDWAIAAGVCLFVSLSVYASAFAQAIP